MKSMVCAAMAVVMLSAAATVPIAAQRAPKTKPDLVVLLAIDQFGQMLFDRWRSNYKSGLKQIADEGVVYNNAYQSHGITETCAGHSTLLTGKHPGHTGIVANEWYDTQTGKGVYCVADANFEQAHEPKARKVGPGLLATTTLGDWLKAQQPNSRVVVISGKDRASITMAGRNADGVFWYDDNFGFTTLVAKGEDSAAKLAPVAQANARYQAEAATRNAWTYFNEGCKNLEASYQIGNLTWQSKLPPELPQEEGKPPGNVRPVHIVDPFTLDTARDLVTRYELGRRGVTDLLAVSLSATDFIGHGYGTQGPEMCDQMSRLDAQIGEFLKFLDGTGARVLLAVTGDHGGSDFTERLMRDGFSGARRLNPKAFQDNVNAELKQKFGLAFNPLTTPDNAQFYAVDKDGKQLSEPLRTQVIDAAIAVFRSRPEIEQAFSITELLEHTVSSNAASDYSLKDRFSQSAMKNRSGDIIVAYKSGISVAAALPARFIMGHAGPYHHDTAVPIMFWWKGARPQTRILPIDTTSIAPTLANIIGVKAPSDLDGPCLDIGWPGAPIFQ